MQGHAYGGQDQEGHLAASAAEELARCKARWASAAPLSASASCCDRAFVGPEPYGLLRTCAMPVSQARSHAKGQFSTSTLCCKQWFRSKCSRQGHRQEMIDRDIKSQRRAFVYNRQHQVNQLGAQHSYQPAACSTFTQTSSVSEGHWVSFKTLLCGLCAAESNLADSARVEMSQFCICAGTAGSCALGPEGNSMLYVL